MKLLDKIKLIIEARSFYVKKMSIPDIDFCVCGKIPGREKWHLEDARDWLNKNYTCKIKRILRYDRDERNFGWVVWYI